MPTAFGNIKPEEHQAVLAELEESRIENARLDDDNKLLQESLRIQGIIDMVADMARRAVVTAEHEGEVDQLAALILAEQVADPIKQQKVNEIVKRLKNQYVKDTEKKFNDPDWVADESDRQARILEQSGAYSAIYEEIRELMVAGIRDQLITQRKKEIDEQLATPEALEQATLEAQRLAQPELDEYRRQREAQLPRTLKEQAMLDGSKVIDDELARKVALDLPVAIQAWVKSNDGEKYRNNQEAKLRKTREEDIAQGGRSIIDGELHTRQEIFDTYLRDFELGGVDLKSIPDGTAVTIALGEVKQVKNPNYDYYNRDRMPEYLFVIQGSKRVMTLESRGDGMFYVRNDSLGQENNPYLKALSLRGKVISVGRHVDDRSNGQTGIEHKISKGEVPCFDDNTTSPDIIIDGQLPIANISIAGIPAIAKHASILKD